MTKQNVLLKSRIGFQDGGYREEAESMPCTVKFGETLKTHLAGKATEKMQNFDPSTPLACTENLHFTLNVENRRAPGLPDTWAQMAWEDVDKVS
jgi:hypothetical protein